MERRTENKIILITRQTRLAELITRFNTVAQAKFYVEHLGADFSDYQREDAQYRQVAEEAERMLGETGRLQRVDRSFLPNFIFAPSDTVVALGQDGLVANTIKYLSGQPLIGVNPDPARWDGVLLPFQVGQLPEIVPEVFAGRRPLRPVTLAKAVLNTGAVLYGVNDLFIGPKSHESARYEIELAGRMERHSSSGIIVSTGLGSTGWFKSLTTGALAIGQAIKRDAGTEDPRLAAGADLQFGWGEDFLYFTVREPFPSKTSGASIVFGKVTAEAPLIVRSQMPENGVIFSDGIEKDFLQFTSGMTATITIAERKGLVVV